MVVNVSKVIDYLFLTRKIRLILGTKKYRILDYPAFRMNFYRILAAVEMLLYKVHYSFGIS